jgi:hypothetical protein
MPIIMLMDRCRALSLLLALALVPAAAAAPASAAVDSIRISDPGPVLARSVYDLTITGVALRHATAYLFVDYAGCAATLTGELRRAGHSYDSFPVSGAFAQVTGWKSSSPGTDHACAYLAVRGGRTLATARMPFVIR